LPGYTRCHYVCAWLDTPAGAVPRVDSRLYAVDIVGRWAMRWGLGRSRYRVAPGLYAVGTPNASSPVLVSANYKLSFDVLRRDTAGLDAWILVIDTKGINVWCAAGKGTFGTAEIVSRVRQVRLDEVVDHRTLIVPQLGAVGVAAHEVKKGCGFTVSYGPVRAVDIKAFLAAGNRATPQMRRVTFTTWERFILTPVELTVFWKKILWTMLGLFVVGGIGPSVFSFGAAWSRGGAAIGVGLAGLLTGCILVPTLLPWIPGRAFAVKGALAGLAISLLLLGLTAPWGFGSGLAALLGLCAVASFAAMNFTGSSTFTSPTGVEKEMRQAIPMQAAAVVVAAVSWVWSAF